MFFLSSPYFELKFRRTVCPKHIQQVQLFSVLGRILQSQTENEKNMLVNTYRKGGYKKKLPRYTHRTAGYRKKDTYIGKVVT